MRCDDADVMMMQKRKKGWKGVSAKTEKGERVAARCRGWERKKPGGNPRVWRLGGLGPVWDTLSRTRTFIFFFFCKTILENHFRQAATTNRQHIFK